MESGLSEYEHAAIFSRSGRFAVFYAAQSIVERIGVFLFDSQYMKHLVTKL